MPPKVPALPRNKIEPRFSITSLSAQDICALLRADEWCALESRNQQVVFLYDFARSECSISLPTAILISGESGFTVSNVNRFTFILSVHLASPPAGRGLAAPLQGVRGNSVIHHLQASRGFWDVKASSGGQLLS
jgi:hypothetical protein